MQIIERCMTASWLLANWPVTTEGPANLLCLIQLVSTLIGSLQRAGSRKTKAPTTAPQGVPCVSDCAETAEWPTAVASGQSIRFDSIANDRLTRCKARKESKLLHVVPGQVTLKHWASI